MGYATATVLSTHPPLLSSVLIINFPKKSNKLSTMTPTITEGRSLALLSLSMPIILLNIEDKILRELRLHKSPLRLGKTILIESELKTTLLQSFHVDHFLIVMVHSSNQSHLDLSILS